MEQGDQASFTGELREIDEQLPSDLQLFDIADGLESGDYYVQADRIFGRLIDAAGGPGPATTKHCAHETVRSVMGCPS